MINLIFNTKMLKYLFCIENGLVAYIASPGVADAYIDGDVYGAYTARAVDTGAGDDEILNTWHWNGTEFLQHQAKPEGEYQWDSTAFEWVAIIKPLSDVKREASAQINRSASEKILAVYPDWKQRNMTARMLELVIDSLQSSAEGLQLTAAWAWIKSIRSASNDANALVSLAADAAAVSAIVQSFQSDLAAL